MKNSVDLKRIGTEIKVRRIKMGIQQTVLAEMLEITQTHLSNVENGRVPGSLRILLKLKSIFNCSLEDLVNPKNGEEQKLANKKEEKIKVVRYYEEG